MKYCKSCVLPNTRPNLFILPNGNCTACETHTIRPKINWGKMKLEFKNIIKNIKKKKLLYDCLIPVSGGKDSTWQVILAKKNGLNPLAFTYKPVMRTNIGQKNLDNLKKIGVHHIEFSINEKVEKKFLRKAFTKFGSVAIPMHMAMWGMSYNLAKKFNIPYILWGENSAREYGGSKKDLKLNRVNQKWIKKYGINFGTEAKDWIDKDLTREELAPFIKEKIDKHNNPISLFMGEYFKWDPNQTYKVAKKHGFNIIKKKPKTGFYDYADIDDDLISIHHYLKIYKFGFSRMYDNLSLEIRNKRIKRKDAISIIKRDNFKTPKEDIKKFCSFVDMTEDKFFKICENFRNKKIWIKKKNKWVLKIPLK
jgi:N-acetyl sugar amidotransferase